MLLLPNSLWRVMLRSMRRRPFQSILFIIGVALGVAMIVAIDVANGSAARAFGIFTDSLTGRTTHQITGGPSGLPDSLYRQLRVDLGLREVAPVVTAYVQVLELNDQPLRVFGVDAFAEAPFRGYLNLGTRSNSNASVEDVTSFFTRPNTVLIAEPLAQEHNLKVGDSLTVRYGATRERVTIVGLLRPNDEISSQGLQDLLIADISTAQELLNMQGRLSNIDLIIPDGAAGSALLDKIQSVLPTGAVVQPAAARGNAIGQMTRAFNLSLTALSLLALVVGMFLIYNTVTFSVVQRRPILGVFRALGVTRRQIFIMILLEAAILSILGAIIGLAAGIIMGRAAVVLVTQTVSSLYFTVTVRSVEIEAFTLVKGFAIGLLAALSAALIPALEATTTPPAGALKRSDIEAKVRRAIPAFTVVGVLILILSAVLLTSPVLEVSFGGLFGIVLGFSLFTPGIAAGLMTVIRPVTGKLVGVLGLMAPRSIVRSLSRTSVAIAALMVAVSVIVGVSAMVGSFRGDVENWLQNTIRADILISPPSVSATRQTTPVDPAIPEAIKLLPGVDRVGVARSVEVTRPSDARPASVTAIDLDASDGHRRFVWAIGSYDDVWAAMAGGSVIVSETFANQRGIPIQAGQTVTLVTDKGPHTFPIVAFMVDFSGDQGTIMMRMPVYHDYFTDRAVSSIAVWVKPGVAPADIVKALRASFAGKQELVVSSNRELANSALVVFDQTFAITTALNLLATVVAFIGILSALAALQLERTREFGAMRANGLTRRQLFRLTLMETGLMGVTAGLMSLPVGTVLAWVLVYIINIRSFGWSLRLQLRPEFYTQAFAVALIAALLAGIYPALRIGRIQPANALRSE